MSERKRSSEPPRVATAAPLYRWWPFSSELWYSSRRTRSRCHCAASSRGRRRGSCVASLTPSFTSGSPPRSSMASSISTNSTSHQSRVDGCSPRSSGGTASRRRSSAARRLWLWLIAYPGGVPLGASGRGAAVEDGGVATVTGAIDQSPGSYVHAGGGGRPARQHRAAGASIPSVSSPSALAPGRASRPRALAP